MLEISESVELWGLAFMLKEMEMGAGMGFADIFFLRWKARDYRRTGVCVIVIVVAG